MNRTKIVRAAALAAITIGGVIAPTPAAADVQELRECLHNCYIAYYVETYQPVFYQMCAHNCIVLYDNIAAPSAAAPLAVTRYN